MPRTETSFSLKMAKNIPKTQHCRKSLDGLYQILAPGLSVVKSDENASIIKEPGKREIIICHSDLAKFGTKADLKDATGKTAEELIAKHVCEARKKIEGDK